MRIFPDHLKQHMLLLATVAIATLGSVITGAAGLQVTLTLNLQDACSFFTPSNTKMQPTTPVTTVESHTFLLSHNHLTIWFFVIASCLLHQ